MTKKNAAPRKSPTPNPTITAAPIACPRCHALRQKGDIVDSRLFPDRPMHHNSRTYPGRTCQRSICRQCNLRYLVNKPYEPPRPQ